MAITRDQLVDGLSKVGIYGVATSGMLDYILEGGSGDTPVDVYNRLAAVEQIAAMLESRATVSPTELRSIIGEATTEIKAPFANFETTLADHTATLTDHDTALLGKAQLVDGKVPYDQLPEFPVGRKVTVEDKAERLLLPVHGDLTIAYEETTAEAWGLNADEDPSDEGNWSLLGNAQAVGVGSFNGRTGNVAPQQGDYTTATVIETVDKRYVTPSQMVEWNAKTSVAQVDNKILAAATNSNNRLTAVEASAELANVKGDSAATNILAVDTRLTQVSDTRGAQIATQTSRVDTLTTSKMDKIDRGATNGVASLAGGKVPVSQLPTSAGGTAATAGLLPVFDVNGKLGNALVYRDSASGLCPLDASRKVPVANLPTFVPQSKRVWRDNKRLYNTWAFNTSGNDMEVFIRTNAITDVNSYLTINMRENSNFSTLAFSQEYVPQQTGNRYLTMQVTVPAGWEYAVQIAGGATMTIANIGVWREMS